MAAALMRLRFGDRLYVDSCGLKPQPDIDPFMLQVMDELGADLRGHRSKSFDDLVDGSFDVVVSLTPEAQHRAVELSRGRAVEIEYWPIQDPTLVEGSRDACVEAYRATREELRRRIAARFGAFVTVGG
jgi:protein-tyrosine-phosphatase